jgi:hypothetical protein
MGYWLGGAADHTDEAWVGDVVGYRRDNDGCRDLFKVAVMEPVVAYAVQTAVNGGSELLIFVPPVAQSHER